MVILEEMELPAHGVEVLLRNTANPAAWARFRKLSLEAKGLIHCAHCPYHRWENAWGFRGANRSWKKYRKTQYKVKGPRQGLGGNADGQDRE